MSYKVDRLTGDVLPALKSGNDHIFDACRYALGPLISRGLYGDIEFSSPGKGGGANWRDRSEPTTSSGAW